MKISEIEQALVTALLPMQDDGYRVLGAPTDHAAVGRVFGKGEVRVAYQGREWGVPGGLGRLTQQQETITFAVIVELQDTRQKSHPYAADAIEKIIELLGGYNPQGNCGSGLYPFKDGFVGRQEETGVWIYSVNFKFERTNQRRAA